MTFSTILLVFLVVTMVLLVITRQAAETLVGHHHAQKVDFFRHFPAQPGDIVFLGDSITDGARWEELFPGLPVKNRGINADTTHGALQRMDDILPGQPAAIFILIGTNDMAWYNNHRDSDIVASYKAILQRCQTESPRTRVFVQSILPRHQPYARRIQRLNTLLEELAGQMGCTFINLYPHFAAPDGSLRPELTNDNLHLLAQGYAIWVELLTPYLESLQLPAKV
jgi:lysophospholipase L1-like esterase